MGWLLARMRTHAGIGLVLAVAVAERISFLRWWKAFPGGDTYNFILIAQELLRGSYPVAEKRLPFYPALLALLSPLLDGESAAVLVALISSLFSLAFLYALGRTLGLSKVALVAVLLPFQALAPFLFQSVRGYADTTFLALILGTSVTFLRMRRVRGAIGTGVLAGLAALTRPEGIILPPVLGLFSLARGPARRPVGSGGAGDPREGSRPPASSGRQAVALATGALLAVAPALLLFALAGRPLAPREYLKDAAVTDFGARDLPTFARNYARLWASAGFERVIGEPLRLLRDFANPPERIGHRLLSLLRDPKELPSLLLLAGFIALLRRPGRWLPVAIPFAAIAAPIAWWGVRQRFLIPLLPLVALLTAAGMDVALRLLGRVHARARLLSAAAVLVLAAVPWRFHTSTEAREVQAKNWGRGYAFYQAIQAARGLDGRIAFDHRSSIALALFGEPDRGRAVFADSHLSAPDAATQWELLERWGVRYLVVPESARSAFPVLDDLSLADRFSILRTFTHPATRGRLESAALYEVRR